MNGDSLALLGIDVLRNAKRSYLEHHPLTTADHLGQYACLIHEHIPAPAGCIYYLDSKKRLLEKEILYSGVVLSVEDCCAHLAQGMGTHRAACAVISMARCRTGLDREDLDRASRIALFCEAKGISLSEIMWIDGEGYLPLCRFFGRKS
ncbi:MAG: hypothetical protein IJ281_03905 [Clostridia bacterium]|nr:hypothetical protein [Clostridia bacterium]